MAKHGLATEFRVVCDSYTSRPFDTKSAAKRFRRVVETVWHCPKVHTIEEVPLSPTDNRPED